MEIGTALWGTALDLIIVLVDPGSNKTFKSFLDVTSPIVSITQIDIGVKLSFLGSSVFGTGS